MGANQSNVPVEMIETDYPLRIERYGLVPDTGGAGKYRGGLRIVREFRLLADEAVLNVRSDKRRFPPHGLFGGRPGTPSLNVLDPQRQRRAAAGADDRADKVRSRRRFRHVLAGGGGYGDPLERDPALVLERRVEEKITIGYARKRYGVVIAAGRAARGGSPRPPRRCGRAGARPRARNRFQLPRVARKLEPLSPLSRRLIACCGGLLHRFHELSGRHQQGIQR